jgi:CheY-like chemotaxis protein
MLLNFVREILEEANYEVITAATGEEGLQVTRERKPDFVILDYILPDLKGDEVSRQLAQDEETAQIPVLYMSGFASEIQDVESQSSNVVGFLGKPFTADLLLKAINECLPQISDESVAMEETSTESDAAISSEFASVIGPEVESPEAVASSSPIWGETTVTPVHSDFGDSAFTPPQATDISSPSTFEPLSGREVFFAGDTNFFSLTWALRTISVEKLTGVLRCFWTKQDVELFARDGKILLVTTRDPEVYCSEAPITLVNVAADRVAEARTQQLQTGCPLFLMLAREDLILRDAALQLVQHYGQKLFAQLWTAPRVRLLFEQTTEIPEFANEVPPEEDIEHWTLAALRFVQYQDAADKLSYDPSWIPAYTRDGFERVQNLRLTVAEAQFASQFNGSRSLAQIARNLRLDLKLARLTLFRFCAMEIVEVWPPTTPETVEHGRILKRLRRKLGLSE